MSAQLFAQFKSYEIILEYRLLANNLPRHMYIYPRSDLNWDGILFLHSGLYKHFIIKFVVLFNNYPDESPQIIVQSDIVHPLIDDNGKFNATYQFSTWKPSKDHVYHLLHFFNNSFREDVLLLMNTTPINKEVLQHKLENQNLYGFESIKYDPIDDETFTAMRQIIFE